MSIKAVRTTVTLDADVIREAKAFAKSRGVSFRESLNELARIGYVTHRQPRPAKPFTITPFLSGLQPGLSYDSIEDLLEIGEGPEHR